MKRKPLTHAARLLCALALSMSLAPAALAADPSEPTQPSPCYPTAVTRSEDGTEIRKMYDLGPEDDPGGIPRSDFEQDGYHYTLTDLLKQELPANESRQHTETVSVNSKSKDMGAVLALLPQTKEFITEDGLSGVLTLKLDTVKVEVAGYGSSTKTVTATRTYPGLANQDTQYIPKTIQDGGHSMVFTRFDGTLMMCLHTPNRPGKERMLLFEMEDSLGKLHIRNEITGNWMYNKYREDGSDIGPYEDKE